MKARLTQLFRPGRRSRAVVAVGLVLAVLLSSLIACQQEGALPDGVYCSPYANVVWPVGEPDAEGEDYGSIRLSLLDYNEIDGPHGKPLGEYTLPLADDLALRQLWWGEDQNAGEKGTEEWRQAVFGLVHMPLYRDSLPTWTEEYLIPEELDNAGHMAMLGDTRDLSADSLDITGVTRSSGYLWPLPYTEYGSDRLLGEEDYTLRILASEGVTVQSVAGGKVVQVTAHPVTGDMSVTVAHPDGWNSEYGHLEYVEVKDGAEIKRGDIIGIAREEEGRRWLTYRLLTGGDWRTATAVDPWSVEYRTYDFLPITHDNVTIAGDPDIENTLQSVLRGERGFYNVETGESCFATALPHSDGQSVTVYRFTELDMDNDTIPEVVLWLQRGEDVYLLGSIILHYEDGVVCGYPMGYWSMDPMGLKTDGSYLWSGGATDNGWGRMNFQTGLTENISWIEGEGYYVDGRPATRQEFFEAYDQWDAKSDVTWYAFDGANPGSLERIHPVVEQDWLDLVKPEHEEMQRLVELSSHPQLDLTAARSFSAEEVTALGYEISNRFGEARDFFPIQNAPATQGELLKQLNDQFMPELVEEEYHYDLELINGPCLFADGKMWHRMWDADVWWEYDWDTFTVIDSGEDLVVYEIDANQKGRGPETLGTRRFTLQKDTDGQWKYSKRE